MMMKKKRILRKKSSLPSRKKRKKKTKKKKKKSSSLPRESLTDLATDSAPKFVKFENKFVTFRSNLARLFFGFKSSFDKVVEAYDAKDDAKFQESQEELKVISESIFPMIKHLGEDVGHYMATADDADTTAWYKVGKLTYHLAVLTTNIMRSEMSLASEQPGDIVAIHVLDGWVEPLLSANNVLEQLMECGEDAEKVTCWNQAKELYSKLGTGVDHTEEFEKMDKLHHFVREQDDCFKFTSVPAEIISAMDHFQDSFNSATACLNIEWKEEEVRRNSVTKELLGLMVSRLQNQDALIDAQCRELSALRAKVRQESTLSVPVEI